MNSEIFKQVLFVGPLPPPLGGVAVMNKSFQDIVCHKWEVICFDTSRGTINEDLYKKKGVKNLLHFINNVFQFLRFQRKYKYNTVNIFVTSNMAFIRDALIIILLRLLKKNIVVHFHSKKQGEYFLHKDKIWIIGFVFRFVKKIVVLSDDHINYFKAFFEQNKMIIIENFVDYKHYANIIEKKELSFLYVSRLSEKKGFYDLIEAIHILKNKGYSINVNVLGTSENEKAEYYIKEKLLEYNLVENIVLHGNVFGKDKYDFFKKSKMFLFPSHFENSPLVLKEAIASNMAIIASDILPNKNILLDKQNTEFFKVGNAFDLAQKIEYLIDNPNIVKRFMEKSESCRAYDSSVAFEKIDKILLDLHF
ncbi:MAG: glycosyltransferase family 4 protein [Sphingobacteriales bacterium]|jgi:glycosyltransferase involved in cell wall biosynthesis|nr:glycosyltransferase family 4 protein [Sphingobacteriales bacterium]